MKENNIEEDIKIVENYLAHSAINETDSDFFKNGGWETVDLEIPKSMQHILSDYKRILKENEKLKALDSSNSKMIANMSKRHFQDREKIRNSIPVSLVKDKIEELNRKIDNGGKTYGRYGGCVINSENIMKLQNQIEALQELLEKEQ